MTRVSRLESQLPRCGLSWRGLGDYRGNGRDRSCCRHHGCCRLGNRRGRNWCRFQGDRRCLHGHRRGDRGHGCCRLGRGWRCDGGRLFGSGGLLDHGHLVATTASVGVGGGGSSPQAARIKIATRPTASIGSRGRVERRPAIVEPLRGRRADLPIPRKTCQRSRTVPPSYGYVGLLASGVVNDVPPGCRACSKARGSVYFFAPLRGYGDLGAWASARVVKWA